MKCGFDIPPNTCGAGLSIHHWGSIIVNSQAHIGSNCCMQQGIVIGFNGRTSGAPKIGDNVYIGAGAKILGNIEIADNCIIGANSVVTKSFLEPGSIIAGVPAHVINKK